MQHTGRQAGRHTRICQHPFRARKSKFALSLVLEILPQPATTDQSSCFHLVGAETEESRGGQKKEEEKKKKMDRKKTAQPKKKKSEYATGRVFKTRDILQFDFWHAQLLPFLAEDWMRRLIPLCHLCEVARQPAEREPGSVCACGRPLFSKKLSERVASVFVFLLFIHSFSGLFVRVVSAARWKASRAFLFRGFIHATLSGSGSGVLK